ncbi:MAG: 16S rRNA G966 N2-methylase RsmD [Planctomycetota bacterium]|jgi:16S rRNA G966 N2-methylase RsmD
MRIISGEFRGHSIKPPADRETRPMLDRVREAMFSTLGNAVVDADVLDLYAGTGSLGLEALSRGASFVRFVERGRSPRTLLEENIAALELEPYSEVQSGDALRSTSWRRPIQAPSPESDEGGEDSAQEEPSRSSEAWADLIFMDPPYPIWKDGALRSQALEAIEDLIVNYMDPNGVLVLHTAPRDLDESDFERPAESRRYGRSILWYLKGS